VTAPYRKKLIEVALPLKAINEASAREKSIRHGHPSTLHLWWARRPLAACRAVLFASLVDDPDSDPVYRKADGTVDEDRAGLKRAELFNLIEELVKWENSNNPRVINAARAEIARCVASRKLELGELARDTIIFGPKKGQKHPRGADSGEGVTAWDVLTMKARPEVVNAFLAEFAPPVLDPFCGGGSIPLEAQRLGLRAYASDLNPVPVLITKALIEIPPKFAGRPPVHPPDANEQARSKGAWSGAEGLAEDVRYYGKWMRDEAEKRIGHLYPKLKITKDMAKDRPDLAAYIGQELTVIAWLWARTVASPNPAVGGVHVPLVRSFWLTTKKGKEAFIEPIIDRKSNSYRFVVRTGKPTDKAVVDAGTKLGRGCKFRCLLSDQPIAETHIKGTGARGELGATLLAVVAEGARGRVYLSPECVTQIHVDRPRDLQGIDSPLADDPRNLWCLGYGLDTFDKLFTSRQLVALTTFSDLVQEARAKVLADARRAGTLPHDDRPLPDGGAGPRAYADSVATYLAFGVSKCCNLSSTLTSWMSDRGAFRETFARQALPMVWDFAEANPFSDSGGNMSMFIERIADTVAASPSITSGSAKQLDATAAINGVDFPAISTDPPYYDNIGYADLSDFFYVWLRRSLKDVYPSLFATALTPKAQELIASPYRHDGDKHKAQEFFETGLGRAFSRMHEAHASGYPLTVYYAFKQSESDEDDGSEDGQEGRQTASTGWETMLAGLIRSGFAISGTWPMRTESPGRAVARGTNALASSIVLVCRPRASTAPLATRKDFINALRHELPDALKNLQHGNIAPVDLAQSAIGPGMAVFTRYAKVIESDGSSMTVRTALGIINQVLDEVLAEQEGDFDADTRWALAWFDQFGVEEGQFGIAETLSKAKNTAVNALVEAGIVKSKAGKVRLLRRDELPDGWDPTTDTRLRHWEVVQHLIHTLETKGEAEAAKLLNRLGGMGETARELAYRLYSICERKKWADEALAYNSLVIAWPELSRLALSARVRQPQTQSDLFS
jgi:putative DNA methylase